ncbi:DUF2637 domain-containing protein [Nonomuraea sp. NPDC050691]|uniref:DUF2637 domain-containing protein n=1 Tax=Nonomuraea sp. NPDC050691 TaxID=3155661 RepID=UPI0033F1B4E7
MNNAPARAEKWIRWTTTASVLLVAGIAAVVSFRHMYRLALQHGEEPVAAALIPLAVDGTIVAASMSLLLASRYGSRGGLLPWTLLVVASLASLGANVAIAKPSLIARCIAAWPSLALIGAYELLMRQIRISAARAEEHRSQATTDDLKEWAEGAPDQAGGDDPEEGAKWRRKPDRAVQREAWQWARAIQTHKGQWPSGKAIAQNVGRSPRWGRLVKRAGLAGEYSEALAVPRS